MHEQFQFDRERFKDVVHFAVHYAGNRVGPEALGRTKLHRILYFADTLHYLDTGAPLTGADSLRAGCRRSDMGAQRTGIRGTDRGFDP